MLEIVGREANGSCGMDVELLVLVKLEHDKEFLIMLDKPLSIVE